MWKRKSRELFLFINVFHWFLVMFIFFAFIKKGDKKTNVNLFAEMDQNAKSSDGIFLHYIVIGGWIGLDTVIWALCTSMSLALTNIKGHKAVPLRFTQLDADAFVDH